MMFVRLSIHLSDGTGVHSDHSVHFSADLSLGLDSPQFRASGHPDTKACPLTPNRLFPVLPRREMVWMCKLGEELNANNDK